MAVTFRTYRDAHVALRIPGCATALRRRILLLPRITYHYRLTNYQNTAVSARLVIAIQSHHLTKPPSLLQRVTPHHPAAPAPFIPRSCTQWNPMCDVRGRYKNLKQTRSSEPPLTGPSTVALLNPPLQFAHARCCTRRLQQVPPPPPSPPSHHLLIPPPAACSPPSVRLPRPWLSSLSPPPSYSAVPSLAPVHPQSEVNVETVNAAASQAVHPLQQQQQIRMEQQMQQLTVFIASHSDPVLKSHLEDLNNDAVCVMKKHDDILGWLPLPPSISSKAATTSIAGVSC